ncbi:MAG: HAMP domain-containing protein [Deltaproteobacteria bacterium]|nr:HAMP domain-containing protein [Deltaproteobacteria bacterium]PWB67329.1 MAG: hypothetical protein C3F14_02460 [Deltaproteobacteria bacterium]
MNPRFQFGVTLSFSIAVFAGGALFGWSFYRCAKSALRIASLQAHYHFLTPYAILEDPLIRHVAILSAGVLAACLLLLALLLRRIRRGVGGLVDSLHRSAQGDLSTPTGAEGLTDIVRLGTKIDAARTRTLQRIHEIRAEVDLLRNEPLPDEEFARRWSALKTAFRKVAP